MAAQISATYASPGLRHGLLQEDYPGVDVIFEMLPGSELNIPPQYGGDGNFCVATIVFPPDAGRPNVRAYKIAPARGNADDWNVLCTKALGRALKRAGYPDDTKDLKALVLWRQREAEIRSIDSGHTKLALNAAPVENAIEAAGTVKDAVSVDDGEAPTTDVDVVDQGGDDDIIDAEIVVDGADEIVDEAKLIHMRQTLGALPGDIQKDVTAWARKQGIRTTRADLTHAQVDTVLVHIQTISTAAEEGHGDADAEAIAEIISGLDATELKTFRAFCKGEGIDAEIAAKAPGTLSADQQVTLLGWLDVGTTDEF